MARLKEETRSSHDRIERDPLSRGMLGAELSPRYYRMVLEAYFGLYAPIESRLLAAADWPGLNFVLSRRLKTPMLRADLAYLGLTEPQIEALPRCDYLSGRLDLPAALGCMYVLEGSTLGGQLIARHIQGTLGYGPDAGLAFFTSYGPEIGPFWKEFKTFAEQHGAGHEDSVIAAASAMFAALERWFYECYRNYASAPSPLRLGAAAR